MATVTALGVGDSESLRNWNTNLLVQTGAGNLLIDCGYTIKYALIERGLALPDIDSVFITHVHGDHMFGLERLGFESRYVYQKRATVFLEPALREPLWDQCLFGSMGYSTSGENELESFFDIASVRNHRFTFGDVCIETFQTRHTHGKPSFGVILNDSLIHTSDTTPLPWLGDDRTARTIWHDCNFSGQHPAHATVNAMLDAYPQSVRERIHIIHYPDSVEQHRAAIEQHFGGIVMQGETIEL